MSKWPKNIFFMKSQVWITLTGCECGPDTPAAEKSACGPKNKCGDACTTKKNEACKTCAGMTWFSV